MSLRTSTGSLAFCRSRLRRRENYLTFDDGPNHFCTPHILDLLAEHRIAATFCVIGEHAAAQPRLIERMIAEGHEVANHTLTHPDLSACTPQEVEHEIVETNSIIRKACPAANIRYARAPYGIWTQAVHAVLERCGLAALHWSVDPRDWALPGADAIINAVLTAVRPGSIVLLHDGMPPAEVTDDCHADARDQTLMALSRLIPTLRARGYVFSALPEPHRPY